MNLPEGCVIGDLTEGCVEYWATPCGSVELQSRSPWFFLFIRDAGGGLGTVQKGISGIGGIGFKRLFC